MSMSREDAQQFVARMRRDRDFRAAVTAAADTAALRDLLHQAGYKFSERDLVGAMANCMAEMEQRG